MLDLTHNLQVKLVTLNEPSGRLYQLWLSVMLLCHVTRKLLFHYILQNVKKGEEYEAEPLEKEAC